MVLRSTQLARRPSQSRTEARILHVQWAICDPRSPRSVLMPSLYITSRWIVPTAGRHGAQCLATWPRCYPIGFCQAHATNTGVGSAPLVLGPRGYRTVDLPPVTFRRSSHSTTVAPASLLRFWLRCRILSRCSAFPLRLRPWRWCWSWGSLCDVDTCPLSATSRDRSGDPSRGFGSSIRFSPNIPSVPRSMHTRNGVRRDLDCGNRQAAHFSG